MVLIIKADFMILNVKTFKTYTTYDLKYKGAIISNMQINRIGLHNVLNSTAATIVSLELNVELKKINKGLITFKGVERRMELVGNVNNIKIMDDYGHHPTEVKSTLDAVSLMKNYNKLIVIFQPHRYTRTKLLYKDFGKGVSKS